jgi:hypothetical protein
MPFSNSPSWLEALMKRSFTAPTRPRIASCVASGPRQKLNEADHAEIETMSRAPASQQRNDDMRELGTLAALAHHFQFE